MGLFRRKVRSPVVVPQVGERGSFPVERIRRVITEAEFEQARTSGWD